MADIQTLSLCSGIGMLDEGFRAACEYIGWSHRTLGYVERESYAAACLMARMEEQSLEQSPVWCGSLEDLETKPLREWCNAITAGFPCQPWSNAGQQKGESDSRWLWPAILRIIVDIRPQFIALENVPGLVSGRGVDQVLSDLAENGFDAEWLSLTAKSVGASHKRERVFILAYDPLLQWPAIERSESNGILSGMVNSDNRLQPGPNHEIPAGRNESCDDGSAVGKSSRKRRGQGRTKCDLRSRKPQAASGSGSLGNANGRGRQGRRNNRPGAENPRAGCHELFAPGPNNPNWKIIAEKSPHFLPAIEPGFRVLADGVACILDASRTDQLRCAGNGVVAMQAATAFVELFRRIKHEHKAD